MADIIQIRRDTAANWTAVNPILAQGEFGVETDTLKLKIGDGASPWTGLRYYHSGSPYEAGEGISINDFTINNTGIITIGTGGANGTIKANGQDVAVKGLGSAAYVDTTTLPNKDLSNLTSAGANISNWSSNVSNCIIEIPQDVKLTLTSAGQLRLLSGSKVYVPNGTNTFTPKTFNNDVTRAAGIGISCLEVALFDKSTLNFVQTFEIPLTKACSGSTDTLSGTSQHLWYDTTNNLIKYYGSDGTTNSYYAAFPHAIVSGDNSQITSIDQVFNGIGYIGSTVFALPGVKALAPNGRNTDGTLKSAQIEISSVRTLTQGGTYNRHLFLTSSNALQATVNTFSYDEPTNVLKVLTDPLTYCYCGEVWMTNSQITYFETKTAFHAVDYTDYQKTADQVDTNTTNIALKQDEATAVNYDNITNCITEIPQDIKLELSSGTLTLKAGSKVYVPNGTGVFDPVTIESDITYTYATDGQYLIVVQTDSMLRCIYPATSGSAEPVYPSVSTLWYDTTNNLVKRWNGSAWKKVSFPIALVTVSGGAFSSIDKVFNGFGYVGSTVFALPGVKGLIPDGRNADGTLKNSNLNITSVLTYTNPTVFDRRNVIVRNNGISPTSVYLDVEGNVNRRVDNNNRVAYVNVGTISATTGGAISSFDIKHTFYAVDYNDSDYIANCAMPSDRYVDLTLGASGTTYTAPADGYYTIQKTSGATGEWLYLINDAVKLNIGIQPDSGYGGRCCLPAAKGDVIKVMYSLSGTTGFFRFVYANGSK